MANRTTGKRRGVSGRPGARPAEQDPFILERAREGWRLWSEEGWTLPQIAEHFGVDFSTIARDRRRLLEDYRDQGIEAVDQHVQNLRRMQHKCWELLEQTDNRSLNKTALLARLESIEMAIAKLDGSLKEKVELSGGAGIVVQYVAPDSVPPTAGSAPDPQ